MTVDPTCSFTCSQKSSVDFPVIGIKFTLHSYSGSGVGVLQENKVDIPFETSVVLRNAGR
jgi:hypothetical protein